MINKKTILDIDISTQEGQLLMAAISVLSSIEHRHIDSKKFGPESNENQILQYLTDLSNRLYYTEEYKRVNRNNKIDNLLYSPIPTNNVIK